LKSFPNNPRFLAQDNKKAHLPKQASLFVENRNCLPMSAAAMAAATAKAARMAAATAEAAYMAATARTST
jgi:hypothetical protein